MWSHVQAVEKLVRQKVVSLSYVSDVFNTSSRFYILHRCLLSCSLWAQIEVSTLLISMLKEKENLRSQSLAWGPKVRTWVLFRPERCFSFIPISPAAPSPAPSFVCPWIPSSTFSSLYVLSLTLSSNVAWSPAMFRSMFQIPIFSLNSQTWFAIPVGSFI